MLPIRGLYEVAIRVKDLAKSEEFYRELLGLEIGAQDERRNWLFLRAGGQAGLLVLQEGKGIGPTQRLAFTVMETVLEGVAAVLWKQGIAVTGPVFHEWIPAKSVYFSDPDGHNLELCAPVPGP